MKNIIKIKFKLFIFKLNLFLLIKMNFIERKTLNKLSY